MFYFRLGLHFFAIVLEFIIIRIASRLLEEAGAMSEQDRQQLEDLRAAEARESSYQDTGV